MTGTKRKTFRETKHQGKISLETVTTTAFQELLSSSTEGPNATKLKKLRKPGIHTTCSNNKFIHYVLPLRVGIYLLMFQPLPN